MISDQMISKFQEIYRAKYRREISREEALEQGAQLMRLFQLVYKPMTKVEFQKLQARGREEEKGSGTFFWSSPSP